LCVFHRPLAIVSGLTIGDYLLWNWSLNGHHDVLALVSGLTLPPLTIVFLWLLAVSLARMIASTTRHSRARSVGRARVRRTRSARIGRRAVDGPRAGQLEQSPAASSNAPSASSTTTSSSTASSGKLAA
jgi:hypothetical protein